MVGIYKITNLITGKVYIGQSKDCKFRCIEHIRHKLSPIDQDIQKYGIENFSFDSLYECNPDELDKWEEYFIKLYRSSEKEFGYNLKPGGQHCKGESNANSKLTEKDVYNIREAYNNHESKYDVYDKYRDIVNVSYFSNLWEGKSWPNVHYDVYTEDNRNYYSSSPVYNNTSIYTDDFIMILREEYANGGSISNMYKEHNIKGSLSTFKDIVTGRTHKNLPYYDRKLNTWINK